MSEKSKKKKRKKSPSSDRDEEPSKEQKDEEKNESTRKRKSSRDSSAADRVLQQNITAKEDSHSGRRIKKAVHRLEGSQVAEQRPDNEERKHLHAKSTSKPLHKHRHDGANRPDSAKETERRHSKTREKSSVPRRDERSSRGGRDEAAEPTEQLPPPKSKEPNQDVPDIPSKKRKAEEPSKSQSLSKVAETLRKELVRRRRRSQTTHSTGDRRRDTEARRSREASPPTTARATSGNKPLSLPPPLSGFKIPKKLRPPPVEKSDACPPTCNHELSAKRPHGGSDAGPPPRCDQTQVAAELQLARSERRLEVEVMQSYGELTCMDIDPPEEGAADAPCAQTPQPDVILVLDTNILLSHLDYVKKMRSHGLRGAGFPVVLIPWVVLQELDWLKKGKSVSASVTPLACHAISYIYSSLKSRQPWLWGQSMQQAAHSSDGLSAENNDDRVLQCCLQYQRLYPGRALLLCTNDKNLCSKALLSGIKALSKADLESEVGSSSHGLHLLQGATMARPPPAASCVSSPTPTAAPAQPGAASQTLGSPSLRRRLCSSHTHMCPTADRGSRTTGEDEEQRSLRCLSELQDCLQGALAHVLETEMKLVYEELWLEIVYRKPPWSLMDVLHCMKKHWIAVFGFLVPRNTLQTVLNLIDFFNSGDSVDRSGTLAAVHEARQLLKAFASRSSRVPPALSALDQVVPELRPQTQRASPVCDVDMNEEDGQDDCPASPRVSPQEVWSLFENIWSHVYQASLEVFKVVGFDPRAPQSAPSPAGGPTPPRDAAARLSRLSSVASQLLQAFSSVLSSAPGLAEVQLLLGVIGSLEGVHVDSRVTASDLLDCFSQQEFREKLRVGGSQLLELKEALDRCTQGAGPPAAQDM